ncbi:Rrf2 family transcriptional regulator [Liquorilactobacillus capillatus]|uniref:Transcription regulator n=1 Tax=Liquorilactobacillus capillatus DSM 19910 TaxID=1423731 RepID=A0A0R1MAC9_9LACO|nr:Rrf2 family transcriptional regulator [Liquorilactobacillus capillatus]KRL01163.1 transcription regulator [Liquorilactobacillus capillatus DSM 19910]
MANTQLSDATHILVYIALHENEINNSDKIAKSINTDPTMVRRIMSKLRKAKLLGSTQGIARPRILRPLFRITLKDVYLAVTTKRFFLNVDYKTSSTCKVGSLIPEVMSQYFREFQSNAEAKLDKITIQNIVDDIIFLQIK